MVAITVILAAVIAAFVFGMAGNISKTKIVAATVQQPDSSSIVVTYQGGQDAGTVTNVGWNITASDGEAYNEFMTSAGQSVQVGKSATILASSGHTFAGKDHVVATAHFSDGTDQVILDNTI